MAKQERAIFDSLDNSCGFWQHRSDHAQVMSERPHQQSNVEEDRTLMWLCVIGTIGFLALFGMRLLWRC